MGPRTEILVRQLSDVIDLLKKYQVLDWETTFVKWRGRIANSDYSGVESLYSSFRGMASFSDLVLPTNNSVSLDEWREDNNYLNRLRKSIYSTTVEIRQNYEISRT